jgi:hypothetical protein
MKFLEKIKEGWCDKCVSDEYWNYIVLIDGKRMTLCQICYDEKRNEIVRAYYDSDAHKQQSETLLKPEISETRTPISATPKKNISDLLKSERKQP